MSVRYVLLPRSHLGKKGAPREAALLRSGKAGLTEVFRSRDWRIFEFTEARPLLSGPGAPRITLFSHDRIVAWTDRPGTYRLAVRYMPYWDVGGPVCVTRAPDGMTTVRVRRPGHFALDSDGGPTALVSSPLGGADAKTCR